MSEQMRAALTQARDALDTLRGWDHNTAYQEMEARDAISAIDAALSAQPQSEPAQPLPSAQVAPSDWVMVPREPTQEMMRAAMDCQDADPGDSDETYFYHSFKAALAASPSTPTAAPKEKL
jgi:hypothetical protein